MAIQTHSDPHADAILVYPGISVNYHDFAGNKQHFHHDNSPQLLEINHCHYGRVGWDLNDGTSIYMGEGDITLHSAALCSDSTMYFPLGSYQGISIAIDLDILAKDMPPILRGTDLDLGKIQENFCKTDSSVIFSSNEKAEQLFSPLYHLPEALQLSYLQLKVQELLLFLSLQSMDIPRSASYNSDTTETIREIHELITRDLQKRYTIPELSARFLINTTTLKEVFKAVYGTPIATYLKEYRIRHAAKLLRHTDDSIASIASEVGYETQSKFTKAFKELLGMTPREYRSQS